LHTVILCGLAAADHAPGCIENRSIFANRGFLIDETSMVSGAGDVSVKGKFNDRSVTSKGWMKGSGSISLESLRSINKTGCKVDFYQRLDQVFAGGQLKNCRSMKPSLFEKGIGASLSERFDLSRVYGRETDMMRSENRNNNIMLCETALASEGLWGIKNMRGWSIDINKSEQDDLAWNPWSKKSREFGEVILREGKKSMRTAFI
jgi:hypothetical protein